MQHNARFLIVALLYAALGLAACNSEQQRLDSTGPVPAPCGVAGTELAGLPRVQALMDPDQAAQVRATAEMLADLPPPADLAQLLVATNPDLDQVPDSLDDPLPVWTEGDMTEFTVQHAASGETRLITAELIHASDRSLVWLEIGFRQKRLVRELGARFDDDLIGPLQDVFGVPPNHGFDRDPRIHILFAKLEGNVAGFFSSRESISKVLVPESNEKEMLFIDTGILDDQEFAAQVVAHEYVHFLQWSNSVGEQEFIDEGLAELPLALGMFQDPYIGSLVQWSRTPLVPLIGWSLDEIDNELHYGGALGYAAWMTETFGLDAAAELLAHPEPGAVGVNGFLNQRGCQLDFDDSFADFILASFLGEMDLYGSAGRLGIQSLVEEQDAFLAPDTIRGTLGGSLACDQPVATICDPISSGSWRGWIEKSFDYCFARRPASNSNAWHRSCKACVLERPLGRPACFHDCGTKS